MAGKNDTGNIPSPDENGAVTGPQEQFDTKQSSIIATATEKSFITDSTRLLDTLSEVTALEDDHSSVHGLRKSTPVWLEPTFQMLLFVLLGLLTCTIHHIFYTSRRGKIVDDSSLFSLGHMRNQKVISFFGTAFAFIVKSLYTTAVTIAYEQVVWSCWAKWQAEFTLTGVDSTMLLPTSVIRFLDREVWRWGKGLAVIAGLIWLSSLGTVFTPGTISVISAEFFEVREQYVPTLDFLAVTKKKAYGSIPLAVRGRPGSVSGAYSGPSFEMVKLAQQTAFSAAVLPGPSPCELNCTYAVSFNGPAQKCVDVPDYKAEPNSPFKDPDLPDSNPPKIDNIVYYTGTSTSMYYLAARSGHELWVSYGFLPKNASSSSGSTLLPELDIFVILGSSDVWQKRTFRCLDYNATYSVNVVYINGVQYLENARVEYLHQTNYTVPEDTHHERHFEDHLDLYVHLAVKDALVGLLQGEIAVRGGASTRHYGSTSQIVSTALVDRWKFETAWVGSKGDPPGSAYIPVENLQQKVEELARNITLSMLGMTDLVYRDTTGASGVNRTLVRSSHYQNVYRYEPFNLIISYVTLTACAVSAVAAGMWERKRNGFAAAMAPSDIVLATAGLGIRKGRKPDILAMKLRVERDENGDPVFKRIVAKNDDYNSA